MSVFSGCLGNRCESVIQPPRLRTSAGRDYVDEDNLCEKTHPNSGQCHFLGVGPVKKG